jgi:hypothetical protein
MKKIIFILLTLCITNQNLPYTGHQDCECRACEEKIRRQADKDYCELLDAIKKAKRYEKAIRELLERSKPSSEIAEIEKEVTFFLQTDLLSDRINKKGEIEITLSREELKRLREYPQKESKIKKNNN